jgi:DNA-binding NarL/FixJ family response regulator
MTTVLLVDDEKLVLRSLEKTLLRAGFEVLTAGDCPGGWAVFEANRLAIDMAVFDLNMPGFDGLPRPDAGLDLLRRVMESRPGLPAIVLTAYDEAGKAREAVGLGASAFFVKGREQGLAELIQKILGE